MKCFCQQFRHITSPKCLWNHHQILLRLSLVFSSLRAPSWMSSIQWLEKLNEQQQKPYKQLIKVTHRLYTCNMPIGVYQPIISIWFSNCIALNIVPWTEQALTQDSTSRRVGSKAIMVTSVFVGYDLIGLNLTCGDGCNDENPLQMWFWWRPRKYKIDTRKTWKMHTRKHKKCTREKHKNIVLTGKKTGFQWSLLLQTR